MNVIRSLALVASAVAFSGCHKAPYDTAPVHGRVTIDGKPFCNGKIMFAPIAKAGDINSGKPAFGHLEADGSYTLTTYYDGDGAVVGDHWVTLIRSDEVASKPIRTAVVGVSNFERVAVPQKKSVVAGQENEINIAITARDIAMLGSRSSD